jgi:hypothetical protein
MGAARLRQAISSAAFWLWAVVLFTAATSLTAAHLYALPKPAKTDLALAQALNGIRSSNEREAWLAVHVLYAQCRCSRRIVHHLAASKRPEGLREKLLLVGSNPEIASDLRALTGRGFQIVDTSAAELRDRYHVQAAPLFVVVAPNGAIRYSGGYTPRKQGLDIQDLSILNGVVKNETTLELPVFGCAVSQELRRLLDPLSLRATTP